VLDLGCGPGFWTVELARRGIKNLVAADLTELALVLTRHRCEVYGVRVDLRQENAEAMNFTDCTFSHVNCQGVIHHTPNPEAGVKEIARVLAAGGTAIISVYYRNPLLRMWPALRPIGRLLATLGVGLSGRGREAILKAATSAELVRLYDGSENPIGRAYGKAEFSAMLEPYFRLDEIFLHFFPARALPFSIPRAIHRLLNRWLGFVICARVTKRAQASTTVANEINTARRPWTS
jgi:SAM-dependent methyltransferase